MLPAEPSHTVTGPVIAEVVGSGLTVTARVTVAPTQPEELVSVTVTSPEVEPNVTMIESPVFIVMLAPAGTVHV